MGVIVCDECGIFVGFPTAEPYDAPDGALDAPGVLVPRPVSMRWWVQRWGSRVDDQGRDLCPDHPAASD
jgi:hypothetical protein